MPTVIRPHVVILGGGFGGIAAARALRRAAVDVTVIDRTNHHVFQPLLYQVATASLAPSDISVPIRWLLRGHANARVQLAEARRIDVVKRLVHTLGADGAERVLPYDYLIVATGARHAYFGHPEWEPHAPGLKSLADALEIRSRFLLAFERAELTDDEAAREALQTFVIVGGGPTGVELAGALPLIARRAVRRDFRRTDTATTRVLLVEGGPRILPSFPDALSAKAAASLRALGVEVRTEATVTRVEEDAVWIGDERIAARTVFWAAGNVASPIARTLDVPLDRMGRVPASPDLSIPGHPEVFVIGDVASVVCDSKPVPGVAQGAIQMGRVAAQNILRTIRGEPRIAFHYRNKGDLATIGRHHAVADLGRVRLSGRVAWWFWLMVHILYLAGFRNRASVMVQWAWAYFTYQRGVRLIVR